jgi:hypothetical protein
MECTNCRAQNPEGKNFCGDCGAYLSSSSKEYFEPFVRRQIQDILKDQPKDQRAIEIETSVAIASRLSEWAKLFALFAGLPLMILVLTLAILGIKSFADLSAGIESRKKEIQESLNQADRQVKALSKAGDELMAEYQKQRSNLELAAHLSNDIRNIDKKVDSLAKKIGVTFTASSIIDPKLQNTILAALNNCQTYLRSLGLILQREELAVDVEPGAHTAEGNAVAYYDEDRRTIHVARPYASNPDETVSMYTETKMGEIPVASSSPILRWIYLHITRALAEYLWCSFKDNPRFGSPGNVSAFEAGLDFTAVEPYYTEANTAIWASAFWELRHVLGKANADRLLVMTWQKLKASQPRDVKAPSFVEELLSADQLLNSGSHVNLITGVFERRKLNWSRLLDTKVK